MIQAIFFDFNGVIIDDERLQMQVYQEIFRGHGVDLTESDYFSALGMDDETFVRTSFQRANKELSDDLFKAIMAAKVKRHRELIENELPLFPGVVTFLKATSRELMLGLVSMANIEEVSYVLERAHLRDLFSVVVTSEDVSVCKPAPDCYRAGLEKLNDVRRAKGQPPVLPEECLAIEDSPPGIQSAKAAGMRTLGITNTVSAEALRAAGADVVSSNLFDWTLDAVHKVYEG